jgi:hypothetical protein
MNPPNIHGEPPVHDEVINLQEKPDDGKETSMSSMSIFGENDNNGLLFAPTCTTCFNENKYLLPSKKSVRTNELMSVLTALESTLLFPQRCIIVDTTVDYNQKSNKIFIQAQLFCAPFNYTNVLQLSRSLMKAQGQQVTRGCLDKSTLSELRDDHLNNWEILYSHPKYKSCKNFSGGPVDRESDRQIYRKHFTQVPLLKNFVDTFETLLPYLSVDLV